MNIYIIEWININGCIDEFMDKCLDLFMDECMDEYMNESMDGSMNGCMDECIDECMDKYMDVCRDESMNAQSMIDRAADSWLDDLELGYLFLSVECIDECIIGQGNAWMTGCQC